MRAIHGIYENGVVYFTFQEPDYEGPVRVLVVFPDELDGLLVEEDEPICPCYVSARADPDPV